MDDINMTRREAVQAILDGKLDMQKYLSLSDLTDDEKIEVASIVILEQHKAAFLELAK